MMLAQSAFWTGIFYDAAALAAAKHLVRSICYEELLEMRANVPRLGLETPFRDGVLRDLARDAVRLAEQGLRARGRKDGAGEDERIFLAPLHEIAAGGPTQAERWLEKYQREWGGDVTRIFGEAAL
jgi:glutamate--cysteine ligase